MMNPSFRAQLIATLIAGDDLRNKAVGVGLFILGFYTVSYGWYLDGRRRYWALCLCLVGAVVLYGGTSLLLG